MNTDVNETRLARLERSNRRLKAGMVAMGLEVCAAGMLAFQQEVDNRFTRDPVVGVATRTNGDPIAIHISGRVSLLNLSVRRPAGPQWEWIDVDLLGF